MDAFDDQDDTQLDDRLDIQRKIIRASLNEIANDVGMIMRDEGLRFPVYITVRNSGDSLATIATTLYPTELPCAIANAAPISVAEVAPG
jgi:hypothetical protein